MFELIIKRLMALLTQLLALRRGFAFGNNNLPANDEDPRA